MSRILIIEDDVSIHNVIEELLKKESYNTYNAYSGTEAILMLEKEKYDLILLMTAGEGVSDAELAGMGITLSKQPVKADFDVLQNTLTAGQDLATLTLNTAADGKTASAIILPQEGASGRSLELTLTGGTVLTWPVEADRTFEQGKKTIFNITLKRTPVGTEVEVNATIQPWGTQGTVSGDLEI